MIKKHLIACSVVLLIIIFSKICISRASGTHINSFPQTVDLPSPREEHEDPPTPSFDFADEEVPLQNKKVAKRMHRYLKANMYENIQTNKLHQKAARWFPVIEPILERYGVPEDFKYMPLVESGLQGGTSHKGASGYWQFMPQTARSYGLRVNKHVDERQNLRKSTIAACKYLRALYKDLGSWTLVAAAYNVGENALKQQIARQGHSNYFKLKLNRETASYVYKLVSMKEIIEKPIEYGFAARGKQLLAKSKKEDVKFPDPAVERDAIKALSLNGAETM